MTTENFYILAIIIFVVSLIVGLTTINNKLSKKLENDQKISKRLDLLINNIDKYEKTRRNKDKIE